MIRRARQILGLSAAVALAAYSTKAAIRNHDYYGSTTPWAVDLVVMLVLCAPYVALALLPRRKGSRGRESLQLVLLLVALGLLGAAVYFVETSLSSTAGLAVMYAWMGAWICFGLGSALNERDRNRSAQQPPPPRLD